MKLATVRITNFQSINDSTEFTIGDVTCLVGKNEAGKTALLKALYRLNPLLPEDGTFDPTDDYPRSAVNDYEADVDAGRRNPAQVVVATYALEPSDIAAVTKAFGPHCLRGDAPTLTLKKGYSSNRTFELPVDDNATLQFLVSDAGLPNPLLEQLRPLESVDEVLQALTDAEQTEAVQNLSTALQPIADNNTSHAVYHSIIRPRVPKFLYFDEYYQLKGHDNVEALKHRVATGDLDDSDHPLLGLLDLARLDLDQLTHPRRTEALLSKLEAAENRLTTTVLKYWSQNRHLRMTFDIREAQPEDPAGMTEGMNIWGRVRDTKHMVSTGLGTRSRGFVWFFSFLAWYSQLRDQGENLLLLLDEPGLSLHAKAQADLLRYFDEELKPHHQLIYTTHSPFMIDPTRFERVRIVQDLSIEADSDSLPEELQGTKVSTEILEATPDSLFPLQGALGYEIYQGLFIGPNSLVVEGVSDLLYIQAMSALLQEKGKSGLSPDWTVTPVGGSDKVPTFVALIGAQGKLNVAVLIDYQRKDQQNIENLYKRKLLSKSRVFTYADFVSKKEADVEDMFEPEFYLKLLNSEFGTLVAVDDLGTPRPRILRRVEKYLERNPLPNGAVFNHYRPARYFSANLGLLEGEVSEATLQRFDEVFAALNKLV